MSTLASSQEHRASNGIFYCMEGEGEPLLLLHGLLVSGAMFDPLVCHSCATASARSFPTCAATGEAATSARLTT
jgi:hypothetical protein